MEKSENVRFLNQEASMPQSPQKLWNCRISKPWAETPRVISSHVNCSQSGNIKQLCVYRSTKDELCNVLNNTGECWLCKDMSDHHKLKQKYSGIVKNIYEIAVFTLSKVNVE